MKVKYIIKGLVVAFLVVALATSCDSYNDALLDGIGNTREFSPVGVTAKVRNQTSVELTWTANASVDHYVVEFSADDPNFTTIFKTVEVTGAQLPVTVALEGETLYSIRVKAVSADGLEESKWTVTTANTLSEQLFLAIQDGDVTSKEATLRWVAGSNVTQITLSPGAITHTVTAEEKAAGIATISGLSSETSYQADLFNGTKRRGAINFTTGIDIGDGILVKTTDDLATVVANAPSGSILVFEPGDYTLQPLALNLDKSLTFRGLRSYDKPKLKVGFIVKTGLANLSLIDLDLTGDAAYSDVIKFDNALTCNDILISGCSINNYTRSLITVNSLAVKMNSFTVENSVISKGTTTSGDFIDIRSGFVASLVLKNSTFNDCVNARDFIREDNGTSNTFTGTGLTSNISVENCTLYLPRMTASNRILYVRLASNATVMTKNLFIDTPAIYSNQTTTSIPTFVNNNYYNSAALFSSGTRLDNSGTHTTLDPQVTSATGGDFTVKNQTLIDNKIGDPRWIK
ncbi:DUF5123 domain-containing protein [Flavobacterium cheongpyeongense]|uniref:DUF5123 domain-containing protein n=1 Tax=Flavobacterium cheongpyeongense TaxID=2212651 RepID=A0A2V4BPJ7_9FLAO|nr:DUF5123 domain-containing protein [Flavobacterium cheongpyeongense]PXY39893.1 DUF5123 domain-containing protein [Flavobacterium cheongpyeongense]